MSKENVTNMSMIIFARIRQMTNESQVFYSHPTSFHAP